MRAAMLWTGGKDSALALYRASEQGLEIVRLVTFVPAGDATFHAHPLPEMAVQASQIGIEHGEYVVDAPYRDGYVAALKAIRNDLLVDAVITGDIDYVEGLPNWIRECAAEAGLKAVMPLWKAERKALLLEVIQRGIRSRVSWIKDNCLPPTWLGRFIDDTFAAEISDIAKETGIDICGENGEYHTMCDSLPRISYLT